MTHGILDKTDEGFCGRSWFDVKTLWWALGYELLQRKAWDLRVFECILPKAREYSTHAVRRLAKPSSYLASV